MKKLNIKGRLNNIDVNSLISGIEGFVWATKDICQADIICNALKVQKFEVEIVKVELSKNSLYLIKVIRGHYTGIWKATGKKFKANATHTWTYKIGKVVRFFQSVDTATIFNT